MTVDLTQLAYVSGGRSRALVVATASLYMNGLVEVGRKGTVRRANDPARWTSQGDTALEAAIWGALHGVVSPSGLFVRPAIDRQVRLLRRRTIEAGFVRRWLPSSEHLPSRTAQGRALVRTHRDAHRWSDTQCESSADALFQIALYGNPALLRQAPTFARASGLLDRRTHDDLALADAGAPPSASI